VEKLSHAIIKYKKTVLIVFLIVAALSAILSPLVSINYDMVDYLPEGAQSTAAIRIMEDEFGGEMPNVRVMLEHKSQNN
jgi:predicted RND superfamily exporter protein